MNTLQVRVSRKQYEAQGIQSFFLVSHDGRPLPEATPGAHIDVHIPGHWVRQYSVCNAQTDRGGYLIAVLKDPSSRGGSIAMHDLVQVGSVLEISEPRNHFPHVKGKRALLIAGGIGITPILSIAEQLTLEDTEFELHYCIKKNSHAAFLDRIATSHLGPHSHIHASTGSSSMRLDLPRLFKATPPDTHVYVCGPASLTESVLAIAKEHGWPNDALHREYFSNTQNQCTPIASNCFEVRLARCGRTFSIPASKSVCEVLNAHGIEIPVSCESGVCGTCLTRVLEGTPDHRDVYMTDEEHAQNNRFTPCCSRAHGDILVLDL